MPVQGVRQGSASGLREVKDRWLGAFLLLPSVSESISYRPYMQSLGAVPLLRWWAERFTDRNRGTPLTVVCATADQASEACRVLEGTGAQAIFSDAGTTLRALSKAVALTDPSDVAVLTLGFAFGHPSLLRRAQRHHVAAGNDYTEVRGLPHGTTPEIYTSDLLRSLTQHTVPGFPTTPSAAVSVLARAAAVQPAEMAFRINARPFEAGEEYNAAPQTLPESIEITSQTDISIARSVLRGSNDGGALREMRRWRRASIAMRLRAKALSETARPRQVSHASRARSPKRVLLVSYPSAFSGAEQSMVQLVGKLDRSKFEPICLVGTEGFLAQRLRQAGAQVRLSRGSGRDSAEDYLVLTNLIRRVKPHILHLNAPLGGIPVLGRGLFGVPVVCHTHTAVVRPYGDQLRWSDAVIAVSKFVEQEILRLEIPCDRVHVVYNGVDTEAFRAGVLNRSRLRKRLGIPEAARAILMTARFTPMKRHDLLLLAAAEAKKRLPDLFLILNGERYGESPTYDSALDLILRRGMQQWVRLIPFAKDIRELYSVADLFVLCSEREGMGCCVIEAMAMGVPTIVSNSGGLPELVQHGSTGFLVPAGDAGALCKQIIEVLANHGSRSRVVQKARLLVERRFDARKTAGRVMELYERLLWRSPEA